MLISNISIQSTIRVRFYGIAQMRLHVFILKPSYPQLNIHCASFTGTANALIEAAEIRETRNRAKAFFIIDFQFKVI
jgi:hypothetical protein